MEEDGVLGWYWQKKNYVLDGSHSLVLPSLHFYPGQEGVQTSCYHLGGFLGTATFDDYSQPLGYLQSKSLGISPDARCLSLGYIAVSLGRLLGLWNRLERYSSLHDVPCVKIVVSQTEAGEYKYLDWSEDDETELLSWAGKVWDVKYSTTTYLRSALLCCTCRAHCVGYFISKADLSLWPLNQMIVFGCRCFD